MTYSFRTRLLLLLPFCAALPMSVGVARADITQEYNFTGTLSTAINGSKSVTGQFTIDFTTQDITAFDFTTPVGNLDSPVLESLATAPGETFLVIGPANGNSLVLWFDSSLSPFSGNSFDATLSNLSCLTGVGGCTFGGSGFSSGSATPVPEPGSAPLLLTCGALLYLIARKRMRHRPTVAD